MRIVLALALVGCGDRADGVVDANVVDAAAVADASLGSDAGTCVLPAD